MPYYIDENNQLQYRVTPPGQIEPPEDPEVTRQLMERWGVRNDPQEVQPQPMGGFVAIAPIQFPAQALPELNPILQAVVDDDDDDDDDIPIEIERMAQALYTTMEVKIPEMKALSKAEEKAKNTGIKLQGFRQGAEHGRYGGALYTDAQRQACFTGTIEQKMIFSEGFKKGYEAAAKPKEEPEKTPIKRKKARLERKTYNWNPERIVEQI